ncbi:hypothetical protein [Streptosporangium sp. NPDC049644]|uniref:hypothetical protein n=1 Tax=Streptosporangium sp. NPDC049644 TaxID=3155507 RepID=UPI003447C0B9
MISQGLEGYGRFGSLSRAGRDRPLHWAISQTSHIRPIFSPVLRGPHLDLEGVPDLGTSPGST